MLFSWQENKKTINYGYNSVFNEEKNNNYCFKRHRDNIHTHTHGKMHAYVRHTHKLREMHTHVHARALKSTHTRFILSFCFIFKLKHLFSIGVDLLIPLLYIIIFISLFRVCVQDYFVSWYRTTKIKRDKVRIFISFARF